MELKFTTTKAGKVKLGHDGFLYNQVATTATAIRDFGPPPPLVRISAKSIRVNPRNLPYYVCFWTNPPSPPSVQTSFMYGPPVDVETASEGGTSSTVH